MNLGIVNAIVGGATQLSGSLLNFGSGIYAVNHAQVPLPDEYNYNIVLPEQKQKSIFSIEIIVLIVVMFIVLFFGALVAYKIS